ncbi:MAG: transcription termination factor NusA [Sandaracinaceae bacterium]|nr:transcription termination factor NusA [Sandaracinaceae bacterium]MDW8247593.1 transcription termination factor NusA [Sandaracinaceae bacterium]
MMERSEFSLRSVIYEVAKEKGIDPQILIETVEQAILTAAKRTFGANRELEARFNPDTGNVDLFQYMMVVEAVKDPDREISLADAKEHGLEAEIGEELGFQIFYLEADADKARQQDREFGDVLRIKQQRSAFGRIAAQTAKQVILQRIRDAERDRIYNQFKHRKGELVYGIVRRFERGSNIIVDVEGCEAILPAREQTPRETYRPGDPITALLKEIDRDAKGPQLILSRSDVGLLVKLFEKEVPEIAEGIVKIVAAARDPGSRSKIAVTSKDPDVEPVGACVGMRGSRVQAVVQELRGEKIDIVPFDRDPARFVCSAIAPAKVSRVIIDEPNNTIKLIVPDAKLSLAIGRGGQNVRLASQLSGWKIEAISETQFKEIEAQTIEQLKMVPGIDETLARAFYAAGFRTVNEIAEASEEEIATVEGVGSIERACEIKEAAFANGDAVRRALVERIIAKPQPMSEREIMLLAAGVTDAIAEALERGGYSSVEAVVSENNIEEFARRTSLPLEQAQQIKKAMERFAQEDLGRLRQALESVASRPQRNLKERERYHSSGT